MRRTQQYDSRDRVGRHPDADVLKLYRELTSVWHPWITLNGKQQRLIANVLQEHFHTIDTESRAMRDAEWMAAAKVLFAVVGVGCFLVLILFMGGAL